MKRVAVLFFLMALLLLAAPALSLAPFHPKPVEFELAPGADSTTSTPRGEVVSDPLRAPKRFDLVGLTWDGDKEPAIQVRVRQAGEGWGRWTHVPAHPDGGPDPGTSEKSAEGVSAPVWAGEADYVQYRLSRPVPKLRLEFVNASGTATAADRARSSVLGALTGAGQAVTGLLSAEADPQPTINSRSSWGASECPPRQAASHGSVKASFVHHTAPEANTYTASQVPAMILSICRYHRNTNGWDDIGYNFLVDKYGRLWEGRAGGIDKAVIGAHTRGYNSESTSVANLGTNTSVQATSASLDAMAKLIRWKLPHHGQPTEGTVALTSAGGSGNRYPAGTRVNFNRISGHRDGNSTECPGNALYAQLPDLRRRSDRPPAAPRSLTASVVSSGIALDWADNSEPDLSGYDVYRSTTPGGPYSQVNTSRIGGGSSYTDSSASPNTAYYYVVKAADKANQLSPTSNEVTATPGAAPTYRDVIFNTAGLRSYWRLGEASGTTAADEKSAHPGTYTGGVSLAQPGALTGDTAAGFDGSDDEMTAGGSALALTTAGSLEGWFYWEAGSAALMRDSTSSGGWILAFDNGGNLAYRVGGKGFTTSRTTASVRNGWHHLALTVSGGTARFYIDGALVHTGSGAGTAAARMPWHLMRNGTLSGRSRGRGDEVAVYGSALSATTVAQHYQARR
jgi:hypothetical protein